MWFNTILSSLPMLVVFIGLLMYISVRSIKLIIEEAKDIESRM